MEVLMLLLHSFTTSRHGMYKKDWQQTYSLASATTFLLLLHCGCLIEFLNKQLLYFPFQQDIRRLQPGPYFHRALKLTVLMTGLRTQSCIIVSPHPSWLCMKEGSSSYWTSPMFSMTRIAVHENFLAGLNVLIWMLNP